MKVTGYENLQSPFLKNKNNTEKIKNSQFDKILEKRIEDVKTSHSGVISKTALHKIPQLFINPAANKNEVLTKVSDFLNVMEEYCEKLESSDYTLRDIQGVVVRMQEEKESLKTIADSLPPGERVRDIIEEALIRASVETIKFERGDYM